MLSKLRRRAEAEQGFTLIELLVVVLIIGILAAIAIPSFLGQRAKALDGNGKASVRSAQTAIESYATDNDGKYTGATVANLTAIEPTLADANALTVTPNTAGDGYSVVVTSKSKYGTKFTITRNTDGTTARTCDQSSSGGCPSTGKW